MTKGYKCWLYVSLIVEQTNRELVIEMMQNAYSDTECVSAPLGQWQAISCDTEQSQLHTLFTTVGYLNISLCGSHCHVPTCGLSINFSTETRSH